MRRSLLLAALLAFSLLSGIGSTMATDQGTAVQLCGKNPNCGLRAVAGGVYLRVEQPGGGRSEDIYCPDQGECTCLSCGNPTREAPKLGLYQAPESLSSSSDSSSPALPAPDAPAQDSGGDDAPLPLVIL